MTHGRDLMPRICDFSLSCKSTNTREDALIAATFDTLTLHRANCRGLDAAPFPTAQG